MSRHTPEPWKIGSHCKDNVIKEGGYIVMLPYSGDSGPMLSYENSVANARRIVACVNACAGISTDSLEKFTITDLSEIGGLSAQRDELLAALRATREACKMVLSEVHRLSDSTSNAVVSGIYMADQAIAKAVQP